MLPDVRPPHLLLFTLFANSNVYTLAQLQQKLIANGPSTGPAPTHTPPSSTPAPSAALTTFRQQESLHTGAQSALTTALARRKAARQVEPEYHAPWKLVRVISGHLGWVRSVAVEPGNKWFVTGAGDRVIKVRVVLWLCLYARVLNLCVGVGFGERGAAVEPDGPYIDGEGVGS